MHTLLSPTEAIVSPHATPDGHPYFHLLILIVGMPRIRRRPTLGLPDPRSVTIIVSTFSVPSSDHGSGTYRLIAEDMIYDFPCLAEFPPVTSTPLGLVIVAFASQHTGTVTSAY